MFGKLIPPAAPEPAVVRAGAGVRAEPRGDLTCFYAARAGRFRWEDDTIHVDDVYVVQGNVGLATGHVNHPGTVIVHGDVQAGAQLLAGGDVEIKGAIECANVQTGGNLVVEGGSRDYIVWEPDWNVRYGSGACPNVAAAIGGGGYEFLWPTDSRRISGWRFHDPRNPPHSGLDIGLVTGDPIYASDGGTIIYRGWSGGYGNLIVVYHGRGYQTFYAHLSEIWVECGQNVQRGEAIGAGGSTGYSTGPHLHFEIRLDNVPIDPESRLPLS